MDLNKLLINDNSLIIDKVKLDESIGRIYTVTLFKDDNSSHESTFIIYPFEIAFYFYFQLKLHNEENTFQILNQIISMSIMNNLFSELIVESPKVFTNKLDSIFFLCISWFKDLSDEYSFPKEFLLKDIDLIVCKHCLKLFKMNDENKYMVDDDYICTDSCRNKYFHKFLNNDIFDAFHHSIGCIHGLRDNIINKVEHPILNSSLFKKQLKSNISLIVNRFKRRINRLRSPLLNQSYISYDNSDITQIKTPEKSYHGDIEFLKKYKEITESSRVLAPVDGILDDDKTPFLRRKKIVEKSYN